MTTATDQVSDRARIEIIWGTITRDVARYQGEYGMSSVNSKRWRRIDDTLQELAGMLVEEVDGTLRGEGQDSEDQLLSAATEDIWTFIEARLLDFAAVVLQVRASRQAERAA